MRTATPPLRVRILKETKNNVTIKLIAVNRSFPVERGKFMDRVEKGLYKVI